MHQLQEAYLAFKRQLERNNETTSRVLVSMSNLVGDPRPAAIASFKGTPDEIKAYLAGRLSPEEELAKLQREAMPTLNDEELALADPAHSDE